MCGIVGVMKSEGSGLFAKEKDIFAQLLHTDVVRGHHGTGIFAVDSKGHAKTLKIAGPPYALWMAEKFKPFWDGLDKTNCKILVGHNRLATTGEKTTKNAHPFVSGHITMVHNGTLDSDSKLPDMKKFDVDSEALCNAIREIGIDKALGETLGAYALVFFDGNSGKLNFIRNHERPLAIAHDKTWKRLFWASEIEHLKWIMGRNQITGTNVTIAELPANQLRSYPIVDVDKMEERPLKGKERKFFAPTVGYPTGTILPSTTHSEGNWLANCVWNPSKARWVPRADTKSPTSQEQIANAIEDFLNQESASNDEFGRTVVRDERPQQVETKPKLKTVYPNTKDWSRCMDYIVSDKDKGLEVSYKPGDEVDLVVYEHVVENEAKQQYVVLASNDDLPGVRFQIRVNGGGVVDALFEAIVVRAKISNILVPDPELTGEEIIMWCKDPQIIAPTAPAPETVQ